MMPSDNETSQNKAEMLANIDVAMGGHVAEELFIGKKKISSGCGSDMANATNVATQAIRRCGMFGDLVGYNSTDFSETSEEYNAMIDKAVMKILNESHDRVEKLLLSKDRELRRLSQALYEYDTLTADEIDKVVKGIPLDKKGDLKKVREIEEGMLSPTVHLPGGA